MNFRIRAILLSFLISLGLALPTSSHALPQLTPKCAVKVSQPPADSDEGKLNIGYLLSEDCKTIYVLPPLHGLARLTAISTTASVAQCAGIASVTEAANQAARNLSSLQAKVGAAMDRGDTALVNTLMPLEPAFRASFTGTNDVLAPFASIEGATASILLTTPYSKLLSKYSNLNPDLTVQKLPIKGGYLTVNVKIPDPLDPFNATAAVRSATLEVKSIGTVAGGAINKGLSDFNIVSPDGTSTINFSDSSTGQIRLSLFGVCPFYDSSKKVLIDYDFTKRGASLLAYMGATYTYYYPVQTKGRYKLKYDVDVIAEICQRLVETKTGEISATALAANIFELNGTQAFTVELEQDLLNSLPNSADLLTKFKSDVTNSFVSDMLSKFADVTKTQPIPDVDAKLPGFKDEVRSARHCRSSGFLGLGRSCSDDVYTVRVPVTSVKDRAKQVSGDLLLRYSQEAVQITTVIMTGSAGFDVVLSP